ncbi:zinc-finger-containing protein [Herbaspirillum sp. YR522]|uniref:zinc-finger-containing protein n=1 Tax=Herbaspirillum sp. YR522 TaxID=1144342 RepID=UPI00026FA291|nr:zinc-finger-containing protein [Herbaspirillum sp. YR522]EJN06451.1 Protein of unknown function (DUF3268) [Herbaspirillum sp. YR522]
MTKKPKTCRYCQEPAALLYRGDKGYPYYQDYGPIWTCAPCKAWVGCHDGTTNALGGLANAELRDWKIKAHAAFDPLWKAKMARDACTKSKARRAGYKWLSEQMEMPIKRTHIGYMSVEECKKVVEICSAIRMKRGN